MSDDKTLKEEQLQENLSDQATESEEHKIIVESASADQHFNWSMGNDTKDHNQEELKEVMAEFDKSISSIQELEVVAEVVNTIEEDDAIMDVNFKVDGLTLLPEFRKKSTTIGNDNKALSKVNSHKKQKRSILFLRKTKLLEAWDKIKESGEKGTIIRGTIISKSKGGFIVDCGGIETFLPGSQIELNETDEKKDFDSHVGDTIELRVVKINEQINNAVVSHKALIDHELNLKRKAIIDNLQEGQVLKGVVKNLTNFGAFIDLGGVDGLVYVSDLTWGRVSDPTEVLNIGEEIDVVVLDYDENRKRISLGLKQLSRHPWEIFPPDVKTGSLVKGKIVNIEDYGAFLEISPGVEGLIHISEINWSNQTINGHDYFKLDEEYEAKVVTIDRVNRKMSLSLKQLMDDPWESIEEKFPTGSKHQGVVKNLTPYGVFVEVELGIAGMIHVSDLSWIKRFSHPSEFTEVGNEVEVIILALDKTNRQLTLGHKQLEENPWETFEKVFPTDSFHEATVLRIDERGAIVKLQYDLEAFAPIKHIRKEDGEYAKVGEKLIIKVIEFNQEEKRIMVSHLRYREYILSEAKKELIKKIQDEGAKEEE